MNAVVHFQAPRLPYHPVVEDRFGVDRGGWKVLCEAVFPAASSPDSIVMALAYCRARNLDIFKKPVQIVPIYDKNRGGMVDTVWPGIAELRTTAMRTNSFAGFDETQFGPMIEENLGGVDMRYPEWAQCIVYRLIAGQRVPFIGPRVYWIETYATAKRDTAAPNAMWKRRPRGQLEKCAEAAALRRAFPEEIGNEYAAEEVEGQAFHTREATPISTDRPDVRARLEARGEAEREGFSATAAVEIVDQISDEIREPTTSDLVEGDDIPAQFTGEPTDDGFPGDKPTTQNVAEGLGLKTGADLLAEKTAEFDPIQWAADFNTDLADMDIEEIERALADPDANAKFDALQARSPGTADALNKAITDRKAALAKGGAK